MSYSYLRYKLFQSSIRPPAVDYVLRRLEFDPGTGQFSWKAEAIFQHREGDIAGQKLDNGAISIELAGTAYRAQDLAWLITYKVWPRRKVLHINGDKADNRPENLSLIESKERSL